MTRWPPVRRHPAWFELALVACVALVAHGLGLHALESPPVLGGWFVFLAILAGWIWRGLEVAGRITLRVLAYSVHILWAFARAVGDGLKDFGGLFLRGMKGAWGFLRATYTQVLRPAWAKFWQLVEATKRLLERVFGPVLEFLRTVRAEFLKFYDRFVRPVLDTIGIARKVLRVFRSLGLEWATTLDAKFAQLEERLDAPFRFVLAKINEVLNVVNRIVTADGLFQRLALVRSIERDIRYVSRAFLNWRTRALTPADYEEIQRASRVRTAAQTRQHLEDALLRDAGPDAAFAREVAVQMRQDLERIGGVRF